MAGNLSLDLRGLGLLLEHGDSLAQALEKIGSRPGSQAWAFAAERVRAGATLGEAAQELPKFLRTQLQIGTKTGMAATLRTLAGLLDERKRRARFWRGVYFYPLLLWFGGVLTGAVISAISQAEFAYLSLAENRITQLTMVVSSWYLWALPPLLLSPFLLAIALRYENVRVRLPVLGFCARLRDSASFLRWLGLALRDQGPLPDALELAANGCVVKPLRDEMIGLAEKLRRGSTLGEALALVRLLPPLASWALLQAERAQFEDRQLSALAQILEQKLEFYMAFMASILTVGTYVTAAGMVAWCAFAVFLPLFSTMGAL